MALDLDAVARALADAVNDAELMLNGHMVNATDFLPEAITVPHFSVDEFTATYHRSYGGRDEWVVTCRLFVARSTDDEGQRTARQATSSTGSGSVMAALEAARGAPGARALGGVADDLIVRSARGPRLYQVGEHNYYGIEYTVFVTG